VIYVGMGRPYRPFETTDRNKTWKELVDKAGYFEVAVVDWEETAEAARALENDLIQIYKPAANYSKHPDNPRSSELPPESDNVAEHSQHAIYFRWLAECKLKMGKLRHTGPHWEHYLIRGGPERAFQGEV
jgi:hypothetical protein